MGKNTGEYNKICLNEVAVNCKKKVLQQNLQN